MAFDRPKRSNVRVDDFDKPPGAPPFQAGTPRNFFSEDYNEAHSGNFARPPGKGLGEGIQGPMGCSLDVLVAKLATLQFTVKGKVGEDGKFELMFCSPDPVVAQMVPLADEPKVKEVCFETPRTPEVRYIEAPRRRHGHHSDVHSSGQRRKTFF